MTKTKKKTKEKYKPWKIDDTVKKFINSPKKEKDYQMFKKELIENKFSEEVADIFMRGLKIRLPGIEK